MKDSDNPGVLAFPPLIFAIFAAVGIGIHFLIPVHLLSYSLALVIGIGMALLAVALAIWANGVMKAAGTNVRPDMPTLTIVRTGPYRFTRNPMYLSLCLAQVAIAFVVDDWVALLLVIPLALILHFGVVVREERYLEAKFGAQYLALKKEVRRWI
ncbi:MAG TPA: isoprenylcysteine carboxylmethyltransferase family protein [Chthoniobacterales bacterium]|jgi:protein-S-isoprenylcysteine O-methyltransferase Ste14|nr:isoprenylcysteine carboxylmethyltransferase family protein [Chthoniobacterales bacterium]